MFKILSPLLVFTLCIALLGTVCLPISAAVGTDEEATPAGATTETTSQDATIKLRERLQKILGDQDETAAGQTRAGYIGEVTRISDEAITLKTLAGSEIIPLEDTILLKRALRIPVSEVVVGNWIIVIGQREKNRAIKPELLLVQTTDLKPREHMVTIGDVSATTATSVTVVPRGKTEPITLSVNKNSLLTDSAGETILPRNVPQDISVIVVGFAQPNGSWELGTLKTTVNLAEYKSTTSPSPSPVTKRATPRPATGSATTP